MPGGKCLYHSGRDAALCPLGRVLLFMGALVVVLERAMGPGRDSPRFQEQHEPEMRKKKRFLMPVGLQIHHKWRILASSGTVRAPKVAK